MNEACLFHQKILSLFVSFAISSKTEKMKQGRTEETNFHPGSCLLFPLLQKMNFHIHRQIIPASIQTMWWKKEKKKKEVLLLKNATGHKMVTLV